MASHVYSATIMNDFFIRIILETTFIVGSILTLYCLYLLWARRSYRNAKKHKEWKRFEYSKFL